MSVVEETATLNRRKIAKNSFDSDREMFTASGILGSKVFYST